jgi:hypothetical protein
MPSSSSHPDLARSAAVVNEEIRALHAGGRSLSASERARYELLLVEWAAAVRREVAEAA